MKCIYIVTIIYVLVMTITAGYFVVNYCVEKYTKVPLAENVDLNEINGVWYELYRIDNIFEKGFTSCRSNYSKKSEKELEVIKQCYYNEKKIWDTKIYKSFPINLENTKISFVYKKVFLKTYWVSMIDKNYNWFVLSEPYAQHLWIYSRNKSIDKDLLYEILQSAKTWGIDTDEVIKVDQSLSR